MKKRKFQYPNGARQMFGRVRAALLERSLFGYEIEPDNKTGFLYRVVRQSDGACIAGPGTLDRILQDVRRL